MSLPDLLWICTIAYGIHMLTRIAFLPSPQMTALSPTRLHSSACSALKGAHSRHPVIAA